MSVDFIDINDLFSYIDSEEPEIIVLEGYNGVGKSRILQLLQERYSADIYRPPYDTWAKLIPPTFRWSIFASFVDVLERFRGSIDVHGPLIFDRGFFSGVVYNRDIDLATYYKYIVSNAKIIHILVTCTRDSYDKFLSVRASDKDLNYADCSRFTDSYRYAMNIAGATYVEFLNIYDENLGIESAGTCRGCSHYNIADSCCKHPLKYNVRVSPKNPRCEESRDREVQDLGELQTVSS